ncbi:flagellar hook-basal body complex protein [bacterium]|nr:flagellar hook-basal body complex protein [bacterium]
MLRSLQMAKTSMQLHQSRVDVLANNLANAATPGFRQVLTQVAERTAAGVNDPGEDGLPLPPEARRPGPGTGWAPALDIGMNQATDVRRGAIDSTGRQTDVALAGRGFFVVRDAEGGEFYTRDGHFHRDETGRLVTAAGLAVQGTGGPIELGAGEFAVAEDGTVTVDGQVKGRLRVVDFADPHRLTHRGDSLLVAGPDLPAEEVPREEVSVLGGHLEGSNVDPVRTLVDMIAAQRAFEVQAKVLQANDESLQKTVNTLSSVR